MRAASHKLFKTEPTPVGEQSLIPGVRPFRSASGFKRWPQRRWFLRDCRSHAISGSSMRWPGPAGLVQCSIPKVLR